MSTELLPIDQILNRCLNSAGDGLRVVVVSDGDGVPALAAVAAETGEAAISVEEA